MEMSQSDATGKKLPVPFLLWLGIIILTAVFMTWNLGGPPIVEYDEFYTAERSREMLITGFPPMVQENFALNVLKPPLHYYLTGAALALVPDREAALRLWPGLFGFGSIALAGLLARRLTGSWNAAAPFASLVLAVSFLFWTQSRSALLDTGTAFLTILTVFPLLKIRRDPRWWIAAGIAAALSGLQKYPLGLLPMMVFLCIEFLDTRSLKPLKNFFVWIGFGMVGAAYAGWYLIQALNSSGTYVLRAFNNQFFKRAAETRDGGYATSFDYYAGLLLTDYLAGSIIMLCLLVLGLVAVRLRANRGLLGVLLTVLLFLLAVGLMSKHSERYLVAIYPLLATGTATVLYLALNHRKWIFGSLATIIIASALAFWIPRHHAWENRPYVLKPLVELAPGFAQNIQPDEQILLTVSSDTWHELHIGGVLFYGDLPERIWFLDLGGVDELKQYFTDNVRGIGHIGDEPVLRTALPHFEIVGQNEHVIHFTSKAPAE